MHAEHGDGGGGEARAKRTVRASSSFTRRWRSGKRSFGRRTDSHASAHRWHIVGGGTGGGGHPTESGESAHFSTSRWPAPAAPCTTNDADAAFSRAHFSSLRRPENCRRSCTTRRRSGSRAGDAPRRGAPGLGVGRDDLVSSHVAIFPRRSFRAPGLRNPRRGPPSATNMHEVSSHGVASARARLREVELPVHARDGFAVRERRGPSSRFGHERVAVGRPRARRGPVPRASVGATTAHIEGCSGWNRERTQSTTGSRCASRLPAHCEVHTLAGATAVSSFHVQPFSARPLQHSFALPVFCWFGICGRFHGCAVLAPPTSAPRGGRRKNTLAHARPPAPVCA